MTCKNCVSSAAIRQTDDETENDNTLKTLASEYNRVTGVLAEKYKSSRRSLGKAIKAFLRDLWIEWRTYEGYTIPESYAEAHLGMAPHGYNEADMRPAK